MKDDRERLKWWMYVQAKRSAETGEDDVTLPGDGDSSGYDEEE